jgi:hypothetical protein
MGVERLSAGPAAARKMRISEFRDRDKLDDGANRKSLVTLVMTEAGKRAIQI